ncbi:hypothetical protein TRFO_13137 [Tritrichomonas foetus]|uniref:protein disulfide-isomerase n=1 Tax=Tritrichomonas foetus TaxID=1144522 RepID=A0A1J4KZ65_9EUKA|nr:hypothetical protein TRFO_13137 [Tritrichomonas foetus]|eukprot:OHT16545.1 hypothetical protein TRFO_13137 [Tritrichomonas foetus]
MILPLFLFCIRLKELFGEIGRMDYLTGDKIEEFLNANDWSIIFFSNPDNESREAISYTNAAITIYKEAVAFALADPNSAPEICKSIPCIVPYKGTEIIPFEEAPTTAPSFLNWMDRISNPKIQSISNINKLNELLNGNKTCIFAIDLQEEPVCVPKDHTIYLVSSELFAIYEMTIKPGLYLYRPLDRQLLEITESTPYESLLNTNIQTYSDSLNIKSNLKSSFISGFVINQTDSLQCEKSYDTLIKLSEMHARDFAFSVVKQDEKESFANLTCMRSVELPYFFVINIEKPNRLRWVIENDDMYNVSYLSDLLSRIQNGVEDPYIVSENASDSNNESIHKVVGTNFIDLVYEENHETIVIFTSPNCTKFKFFKPIVNVVAALLNRTNTYFYIMDVSKNDVPESVPEMTHFPTMILWPAGQKEAPIIYRGNNTFLDVLGFVKKYAKHKIKVPKFDIDVIKENLAAIINKIRFGQNEKQNNPYD